MAQLLGQVNPGTIVKLNESGSPVDYLVVHQGKPSSLYDDSCDGTWLLRKDIYGKQVWNSSNNNTFISATVNTTYLPSLLALYDIDIQSVIKTVKIPYCIGNGSSTVNSGANGFSCQLFLLSGYEVGLSTSDNQYFPVDGAKLSYFTSGTSSAANNKRIANYNGSATFWWLRSPNTGTSISAWNVRSNGGFAVANCFSSYGIRPAMIMPSTLLVQSDGTITTTTDLSIYIPSNAMQGQPIPISWSVVSNAQSYQLQRNTGSSWETIYTGADASYTDIAGGDWTTVQYQVAVDIGGGYGAYTQSASIPVIAASTLAISGQDGSLETITADIPYTVTSDTGNPISLVRTVNGVQYASATVSSGFAYNIPVMELPTGDGTIVITASVQSISGLVTVTRTWIYTKTPINFSNSGSVASLAINGQNILPTTLAEAVRTSPVWGGSLDLALQKLSKAAFYETVTPTAQLGSLTPGDIIYLNENGSPVEFYVASMDYEPDYNDNRVLVVRKDAVQTGAWNSSNVNTYDGSTIDTWFNQTYLQTLDSDVQTAVGTTNIPATSPRNSGVIRLVKSVFALSVTEYGGSYSTANIEGASLPAASVLVSSGYSWTRTPKNDNNSLCWFTESSGISNAQASNTDHAYRPSFTLPSTFIATLGPETSGLYDIQNNLLLSLPGVNIETGSYVGTGTYGSSNPNSLTANFNIKFAMVLRQDSINPAYSGEGFTWSGQPGNQTGSYCSFNQNGNTLQYYASTAQYQFNTSGINYYYVLIG